MGKNNYSFDLPWGDTLYLNTRPSCADHSRVVNVHVSNDGILSLYVEYSKGSIRGHVIKSTVWSVEDGHYSIRECSVTESFSMDRIRLDLKDYNMPRVSLPGARYATTGT